MPSAPVASLAPPAAPTPSIAQLIAHQEAELAKFRATGPLLVRAGIRSQEEASAEEACFEGVLAVLYAADVVPSRSSITELIRRTREAADAISRAVDELGAPTVQLHEAGRGR